MKYSLSKKISGLCVALLIILSSLLSACGIAQGTATATPVAGVALPSVQITTGSQSPTSQSTSTPVIIATGGITYYSSPTVAAVTAASINTALSNPTAALNTTTPNISPTTDNGGSTFETSPAAAPTPTPTLEGAAVKVDKNYELKLIKTAYDAINSHLFKAPDTSALLNAALKETASITNQPLPTPKFGDNANDNWNTFTTAFNNLVDNAVSTSNFTYPKGQIAHRTVSIMADAVKDEHTYFLDKDENDQRSKLLKGDNTSVGFGIVFTTNDQNHLFIVRVIPNSPADKGGLKAGDEILKFDEAPASLDTKNVIRATAENSTHSFVVNRPGQTQPLTLKATKGVYTMPTVEYRLINGHIGYIAIREFFSNVTSETDKAMAALYKQGATAWIIDVRDDPGGLDAEEVVGRFVNGGQIMGYNIDRKEKQDDKVSNDETDGPNKGKPFSPLLPVVLLVNDGSASSSEILALGVRDFKLGKIIGQKTIGALGHTEAFPLGDDTAISVTVSEYVSVKDEKLNGLGITPDIIVPMSMSDLASNRDPQLVTAVSEVEKSLAKTGN